MSARIAVRPLGPADREAWLPLWRGYLTFYETSLPDETTALTWRRLLDPAEPMRGAAAVLDGRLVGIAHAIRHRSCWTEGDYCYLQDLFVDGAARGLGAGRALIEHVCRTAEAEGCSRVHWLTHETNADAMKLYDRIAERSGFVQYRRMLGGL